MRSLGFGISWASFGLVAEFISMFSVSFGSVRLRCLLWWWGVEDFRCLMFMFCFVSCRKWSYCVWLELWCSSSSSSSSSSHRFYDNLCGCSWTLHYYRLPFPLLSILPVFPWKYVKMKAPPPAHVAPPFICTNQWECTLLEL